MGKEEWFPLYYENGKIKQTAESSKLFSGQDISNLYVAQVEKGRLVAKIPVSFADKKAKAQVECPFCFAINDFEHQEFCPHFFSLSEGPKAMFIIGDAEGRKVVSVWEGACNIFLDKPTSQQLMEDFTKLIYRTEDRFSQGNLVVFDHRQEREYPDASEGIVNLIFNQEFNNYSVIIYPCYTLHSLHHLFSIQTYTIDRDVRDVKIEEESSNPVWRFKGLGRTDTGTEHFIYATITSANHPFILRSISKTRILYKVLRDSIYSFTEEEYKKERTPKTRRQK
ncbi:MAG TPA: hypothetical protein P5150_06170 [Candidatus Ratteibacteria bacterium]|nr:hypothetical protein [Candidatus Ratteibacteria bacterium]